MISRGEKQRKYSDSRARFFSFDYFVQKNLDYSRSIENENPN